MKRSVRVGIYGLVIAVVICTLSLAASAWGPASRETFTIEEPPGHVVFNSITNNPAWGDERGIMQIKESDEPDSAWRSGITLQPGKSYDVRAYYHNNAVNGIDAQGAYARVVFPGFVDGEELATFILGAENAQHFNAAGQDLGREVFGNITLRSEQALNILYVENSAELHNFAEPVRGSEIRTFNLPMDLFWASGTPIGFDAMDGVLPGGSFYDGRITFMVTVVPRDSVEKALDNVVTTAIFAAILAFFTVCLLANPIERFWNKVLKSNKDNDDSAVKNTDSAKKITKGKAKVKKNRLKLFFKHNWQTVVWGIVLVAAIISTIIFSVVASKIIHEYLFPDTSESQTGE
jgi:hypothetical protein